MAESDLSPMFDAEGLQELGGRAGKKMGGKKCREQKSPSFTAHFFAGYAVSGWLCPTHKILLPSTGGFISRCISRKTG
jgi:hypothetical protein